MFDFIIMFLCKRDFEPGGGVIKIYNEKSAPGRSAAGALCDVVCGMD